MRRAGFTLVEVLVAGALTLVVLGLCFSLWMLARRAFTQGQLYQGVQQSTLAVTYRLRHDFRCARPGSLSVSSDPVGVLLSFLSYEEPAGEAAMWDSQGNILWRKWVQFRYVAVAKELRRREVALPTPTAEPSLSPAAWPPDRGAPVIARDVEHFQVDSSTQLLNVHLRARQERAVSEARVQVIPQLYGQD